jgi:hypothetical protein
MTGGGGTTTGAVGAAVGAAVGGAVGRAVVMPGIVATGGTTGRGFVIVVGAAGITVWVGTTGIAVGTKIGAAVDAGTGRFTDSGATDAGGTGSTVSAGATVAGGSAGTPTVCAGSAFVAPMPSIRRTPIRTPTAAAAASLCSFGTLMSAMTAA